MPFNYHIDIERHDQEKKAGWSISGQSISFELSSRDDLQELIRRVDSLAIVSGDDAAQLTVGIKLLGDVLLRYRDDEMFSGLFPHFATFMKKLKSLPGSNQ